MTVHIVGAGLSGLSAAVRLARLGRRITVWESSGQAGGRCRSYHDSVLDRLIDNGNHLLLSGNNDVYDYLLLLGAVDQLDGPEVARFPFLDLQSGERWTVEPGPGAIPWWLLDKVRRIPGTGLFDYLKGIKLARAGARTVADCVGGGTLYDRFWAPLAVAALNTAPEEGAAALLWPVMRETFGRGEGACRPRIAKAGLGPAFVDPALSFLRKCDVEVSFGHRCKAIHHDGDRVTGLDIGGHDFEVGAKDSVILAVPHRQAADLVPDLDVPQGHRSILNAHFLLDQPVEGLRIVGLVGGAAEWVFGRDDVASVTISAAESYIDREAEELAQLIWPEVCRALEMAEQPVPTYRIVKEKRATFAQTPDNLDRRPGSRTDWENLYLAGDWTDTGLPATIEGAIRSGRHAAEAVLSGATIS